MRTVSISTLACACAMASLVAGVACAQVDYRIEGGVGYSDNILRSDTEEQNETIGIVGVDLVWQQRTRRIEADAEADLSYYHYTEGAYDSEVVGTASGYLGLALIPERLSWAFEDSFGQARTDPLSPLTPENREYINYFATGPDFLTRLGTAGLLRLFGRYNDTRYEESPLDAQRTSAGVSLMRYPTPSAELALSGVAEEIDFDDVANTDYGRESAFLSYDVDGARTDFRTELGYSWIKPDAGVETDGLLANLWVTRDMTASSTIQLELGTQLTDSAEALRSSLGSDRVGGPDITLTSDPFENRRANLRWSFDRNRTGFMLGVGWSKDTYETESQFDRKRLAYEAMFSRRLAPSVELAIMGVFNNEQYVRTGFEFEEISILSRLDWHAGRRVGFAFTVERHDRDSTGGVGYVEHRAFIMVTYEPDGEFQRPARRARERE